MYEFYCLGIGSKMVPGVKIEWPDTEWAESYVYFNDQDTLAPTAFIMWLFDRDEEWVVETFGSHVCHDLILDTIIRTRTPAGREHLTASDLNDKSFTFDQIADLIDYFGLEHDPAREGANG